MTSPRSTLLLALALAAAGCAGPGSGDRPADDLADVPCSPELAAGLAAVRDLPPGPDRPDLARARELALAIQRTRTRDDAADEVYARWDADPTSFVWLNLATQYDHLIHRRDRLEAMAERPDLGPGTAAGLYLRSRLTYSRTERDERLRAAGARRDDLDDVQRVLLAVQEGRAMSGRGEPLASVRHLVAHAPLARRAGGERLEALVWREVTEDLLVADRLDDALHSAARATRLARRCGEHDQVLAGRVLTARARAARLQHARALAILDACLEEARRHHYPFLVLQACNEAGSSATALGDLERAIRYDARSAAYGLANADSLNVPRVLANLAYGQRCLGRLDSCRVYLERARAIVDRFEHPVNRARLPLHEASYLGQIGDYAAAESLLTAAEHDLARVGLPADQAELYLDQIALGLDRGRTALAYRALVALDARRAVLHDRLPNQNRLAELEIAAARLLTRHGEHHRADAARRRALAALGADTTSRVAWTYHRCAGELAHARGDTATARREFARCLDLARAGGDPDRLAFSRVQLGRLHLSAGRGAGARALFAGRDTAFGASYRTDLASQLLLGMSWAVEGRHERAAAVLAEALAGMGPHAPRDLLVRLRIEHGRALARLGRFDDAEAALLAARATLLAEPWLTQVAELGDSEADARRDLAEALVALYLARPGLLPDGEDLAAHTLRLADEGRGGAPAAAAVPGSGPLLAYFVGRERSFAWSVADGRLAVRTLPGRAAVRDRLLPVLADLERPGRPVDAAALAALSDLLLGDAFRGWSGDTLRVIADDLLAAVPWAALPLPGTAAALIDRGPIREVLSLADLAAHPAPVIAGDLALLAIGRDGGGDAARLRHAEAEARGIAAAWPADRAACRTGEAAVLPAHLGDVGVLHLASHATVFSGAPGHAVLRLAAASDAPPLTLDRAAGLDLDAALVYLSCCAAARPTAGGGLSDFARAFLRAGAHTVVASTVRVDDEAAAFLAERFYARWRAGAGRAAALRSAQLATRDARPEWRHPYYWAAYRLIGDGS